MYHPFIVGENIYLRGLEKADFDGDYFQWLNDYEVTRYLETGRFPNTKESLEAFYQESTLSGNNSLFAIIDKNTNKHVGNIKIGPINWYHRKAPIGYLIGNKNHWSKGYATDAIKLVVQYGFLRLGLHKIWASIAETNIASIKACEKAGFSIEGRLISSFNFEGKFIDTILVGITRQE